MTARYADSESMKHVLALLTAENRLVAEVMLSTGLRVSDVLSLRKENIKKRMTVREKKTGKKRRIYLRGSLVDRLRGDGREGWCFPGARDPRKHRTRQAVWKDIKRAAAMLRFNGISPHSCRKNYAVKHFERYGLDATRRALNHNGDMVTMLYALSNVLDSGKHRQKKCKK